MTEFFRFRSIKQLLGKYQELEGQTIYFASPEELNDPMEGFRDIVWSGDKIVWTNLFKNYVHCLFWTYSLAQVLGDTDELKFNDIPIWGRWDEPPSPQAKILFDRIWEKVFNKCCLGGLAENLSNMKRKVRDNELLFYLSPIHIDVVLEIQAEFVKHGLITKLKHSLLRIFHNVTQLNNNWFFKLMDQSGDEKKIEDIYSSLYQIKSTQKLAIMCMSRTDSNEIFEKNKRLLLFTFPEVYVKRLESLLWPQWYTASFMKNYKNLLAWGHYGDGHKGVCLIFEAVESGNSNSLALNHNPRSFYEVRYGAKAVEIDFFRSIGSLPVAALMKLWYSDEDGNRSKCSSHIGTGRDMGPWMESHWKNFYHSISIKSKDWSYEQEYRLVLGGVVGELEKSQQTLNYDFSSLKGIIFGMRTSEEDKQKIIEIIERKCREEKRTDFEFFQAVCTHKNSEIRKDKIPLKFSGGKFRAHA